MATYVNDLRLKEIATGDESGTWGTSTNTNLELIAEAFSFGTEAITTNADTHTTTIADGSTDPGRSLFLKYTGTLDSTCTITIGPNTVSKLWFIENATSGSQSIIISQGSGASITILNGQTKAIYSDGAGSGAAMVDAFQDLSVPDLFIDDDLTFTSDSAVISFGADADTTLTHTDGTGLTLNGTNKLTFGDVASFIQQSSDGVLRVDGEATIDLNASTAVTVSNDLKLDSDAAVLGFGADNDVTLTHVADTGLLLNSTMAIQFNDASQFINAPSATVLDINATDEIELNATLVDVNANLDVSGTYTGAGLMTTGGNIIIPDAGNIGSASDTNAIAIGADGDITLTQDLELQHDGAILSFGADDDTTLTHTDGSGLTLNSTNKIMFNDASQFIQGSSATVLALGATDEIDLTATAIDVNGTMDVSGALTAAGLTVDGDAIIQDATPTLEFKDTDNNLIASVAGASGSLLLKADTGGGTSGESMQFHTGGSERLNIAADGSLSTPTAGTSNVRFGVNAGNSITSGGNYNVTVGDEAGTALTTGDGNVVIGFEAGDAKTTGNNDVAIGYEALSTDVAGQNSVAVGYQALTAQNFTTATNSYNVAVGKSAGAAVTAGIQNTLVGALAGDALTDADNNVALGYLALSADTQGSKSTALGQRALGTQNFTTATDSHNTAVGYQAGTAVTTGLQNTFVGSLSGDATTTGVRNTALGYGSLGANSTGDFNTAIGRTALENNTTADGNTAVGVASLAQNTEGADNVAVGYLALNLNTTASNNTAVGKSAGGGVTTGANNTLIGSISGDAFTTGARNTALGYATLTSDTKGRYAVAIGYEALQTQNFTTTRSNYNVGIGYQAGAAVTTGVQNTLIGGLAGDSLTDADFNVAVGVSALAGDTLGSKSTALGYFALAVQNFTTATDTFNVAIGHVAGTAITTGTHNTLIGGLAGDSLTDGKNNTAIGKDALGADTLGSRAVAIGHSALSTQNFTTSTTNYNVAVGFQTGASVTTGTNNTLIGAQAGDSVTDGTFNTFVGKEAGGAATTGDYNTFIGAGTIAGTGNFGAGSLVTTGSKNVIIGGYNGNQDSLDIRTSSNNVVLSDGDGNPRLSIDANGAERYCSDNAGAVAVRLVAEKASIASATTTNFIKIKGQSGNIFGLLTLKYVLDDVGVDIGTGTKTFRLFWNGSAGLLNALSSDVTTRDPTIAIASTSSTEVVLSITQTVNSSGGTYDFMYDMEWTSHGGGLAQNVSLLEV